MLQTRLKVFRIVPKCPKMSQNFQLRRIVVRTDLFDDIDTGPGMSRQVRMVTCTHAHMHTCTRTEETRRIDSDGRMEWEEHTLRVAYSQLKTNYVADMTSIDEKNVFDNMIEKETGPVLGDYNGFSQVILR